MDAPEIQDRFRAAFLGMAIGDALGFPLRGVPPSSVARLPDLAEDFAPRPRGRFSKGQFSDDTQLMLAAAESVIGAKGVDGRALASHFAWLWSEGILLQPPQSVSEAIERLAQGAPWMTAGAPLGVKDPAAISRGLVAGLWNAGALTRLAHDAGVLAVVTHKDPACAAAAAAFARAVALGLEGEARSPEAFCEDVASAAGVHDAGLAEELKCLPWLLSWDPPRAMEQIRRVGVRPSELRGVEGIPAHSVPVCLAAIYAALRIPHDFREAICLVLRTGGEADATAALCGALLGAHLGTEALPARLRKSVLYAAELAETADRLFGAWQARAAAPALAVARARK